MVQIGKQSKGKQVRVGGSCGLLCVHACTTATAYWTPFLHSLLVMCFAHWSTEYGMGCIADFLEFDGMNRV